MMTELALFILRVIVGLLLAAHGAQKLFGWFGGHGLKNHADWLDSLDLRPGRFWAWVNGLAEFAGGLLLAVGLLTPVAAALVIANLVMAIVKVHWQKGLWNMQGGYEFPLVLGVAALTFGLGGPGAYALDPLLFADWPHVQVFAVTLIIALIGVGVGLLGGSRQWRTRREAM